MEKHVIYFEQFLAAMLIFRGPIVSPDELGDEINAFYMKHGFQLETKEGILYNLKDFVEVTEEGFKLKGDLSLKTPLLKSYTLHDHLVLNAGPQIYNYMHARYGNTEESEQPFEKVLLKSDTAQKKS